MKKKMMYGAFLILSLLAFNTLSCTAQSFTNPTSRISLEDLTGVWEVKYTKFDVDQLTIREDGSYQQTYIDSDTNYIFRTAWNQAWLEFFTDGTIYLHLDHGRYFPNGIRIAALEGMGGFNCPEDITNCGYIDQPWSFYDLYSHRSVKMVGELVVTIRVDPNGEVVFHHMAMSSEEGFPIIGGESQIFRKVSQQTD